MKTCKHPTCPYPVFSHLYCKSHQYLRTDRKPKKIPLRTQRTHVRDYSFGFENQTDLFEWLWEEVKDKNGMVICPYTKERLNRFYNTEMYFNCFSHILPKGKYTYFKLNPKNVRVVHPDFHRIIDQGTSLDRINHPDWKFSAWDNEVEDMKIQYQLFKKQNLLA